MPNEDGQDRGRRFDEIAMTIRNRDAGRCRCCRANGNGERLSVHHLVPDLEIPDEVDAHLPVNLVALCRKCHSELEARSLDYQLQALDIENHDELMLSERERASLNDRLQNLGPESLDVKTVSREEAERFIEQDFGDTGTQTDLSEY